MELDLVGNGLTVGVDDLFDGRFRAGVDRAVRPVGGALRRTGLAPDHLTAFGLLLAVPTAWAVATGRLILGLVLLISSAVPDLLDGALAKASGRATVRGAFFDSVCDRVTDTLVLGGMAWYLQDRHHGHAFALPFAILGASLLISYERAKAESLGFDAKGGLMERAERIVVLCAGLAFSVILVPLLWIMLVLTLITAGQRFVKVWRQASAAAPPRSADDDVSVDDRPVVRPAAAHIHPGEVGADAAADAGGTTAAVGEPGPAVAPVAARWRAWREANGWAARPARFAEGSRASSAAARRHARRQARRIAERPDGDPVGGLRRRSGSRRP